MSDISWLRHDGEHMSDEDWNNSETRSLGVFYAGNGLGDVDNDGNPLLDDDMLLLVNAHSEAIDFSLPFPGDDRPWKLLVDTTQDDPHEQKQGGEKTALEATSLKLFTRERRS